MALFTNEVLTKYRADVSQEVQALDQLIRKNEQLKQAEASAAKDRERHFDELVLDLTRAARAQDELVVKTESTTSGFQKFKGGMKAISEVVTPFNQGLELANKAIGFAKDGLEAYAKTSPLAAKEVRALEQEFANYKQTVLSAVGEVTVALLDNAVGITQVRAKLIDLTNDPNLKKFYRSDGSTRSIRDMAVSFYGQEGADELLSSLEKSGYIKRTRPNENDPLGALTSAFDNVKKSMAGNVDYWNTKGSSLVDSIQKGMDEAAEAAKKAKAEFEKMRDELEIMEARRALLPYRLAAEARAEAEAQRAKNAAMGYGADPLAAQRLGIRSTIETNIQAGPSDADLKAALDTARAAKDIDQKYIDYSSRKNSKIASIFGPAHEVDLYNQKIAALADTFSAFTDAVGAGYEAIVTGQGSVSKAFKTIFADSLMAMGKSSAIEAIRELALGFGSLALGPMGGVSASMHFKSAALHGAVAVAAGAAAHSLGTSAQAAAADKAAEEKKKEEEKAEKERNKAGGKGSGGGQGGDGQSVVVVYADPFAEASARERALTAERTVKRALGGSGGTDS